MVWTYILKVLGIITIVFLVICLGKQYQVFTEVRDDSEVENAGGWVAFGMLAEIAQIVIIAIQIIN